MVAKHTSYMKCLVALLRVGCWLDIAVAYVYVYIYICIIMYISLIVAGDLCLLLMRCSNLPPEEIYAYMMQSENYHEKGIANLRYRMHFDPQIEGEVE